MRLLIVDDEKLIVAGLAHMVDGFEIPNLSVWTALRGTQALEIMKKECIDLVLVDVAMPGMSGLELIRNAQEKKLCSDFIVISGRQDLTLRVSKISKEIGKESENHEKRSKPCSCEMNSKNQFCKSTVE